jgi:hypothetical protein
VGWPKGVALDRARNFGLENLKDAQEDASARVRREREAFEAGDASA